MSDFDEPLKDYDQYFRDHHARNVSEYFEALVRQSGVDEAANIETVAQLRELERGLTTVGSTRRWWRIGRLLALAGAIALATIAANQQGAAYLLIAPAIGLIAFIFAKVNPTVTELNSQVSDLESQKEAKSAEAWLQMEPLNRLYEWEMPARLFQTSYPDVQLDRYLSFERLADLVDTYGLTTDFNDGRSILATQSGSIKGNPFVFARFLQHWIGSHTYIGTLVIRWTEQTRNANGQLVTVQKSQTLTASVLKPFPEFQVGTGLIYGHEAAPNLTFSRKPSRLSGLEDGKFNNWRKERAVGKVAKQARKQLNKGTGQLTVMSNREFEALFNAVDRNDELEFRLLFTPLAQQEMVELMNDEKIGFGDDFRFTKLGAINLVEPEHLNETRFDGDPRIFHSLELAEARRSFNLFQNEYFRSLYFALAPLLTVPLYREERSVPGTDGLTNPHESTFWEHEAMANLFGEGAFKHPDSVTHNLLKTRAHQVGTSTTEITVTAHGYRGIPRVDYVPVRGGDGNIHQVPVPWTEYIAVQQDTKMLLGVVRNQRDDADSAKHEELQSNWHDFLGSRGLTPERAFVRGTLAAILL